MADASTPPALAAAADRAATAPPAWLPVAAAVASAALFIGMDATAKLLTAGHGAWQVTFLRFAAGTAYALPLWLWWRTPMPRGAAWRLHALRSVLLLLALLGWFHSLSQLPLVQSVAVGYTAPIFISLLAMAVLRERPSRWIWAALALGAVGVAVSLWPELRAGAGARSADRLGGLAAAGASALCYSGVVIVARHQARVDALWTILLIQNLLPTLLLAAPMALVWQPLLPVEWAIVALMGLLGTGGLLAITWAFRHLEASRAAPLEYTGLVWAAVLGYTVFGEVPTAWTLGSAALIVAGCLLLLRR